jgi:RNA polymerase primary sigma factor
MTTDQTHETIVEAQINALIERGEEQGCVNLTEMHQLVQSLELDDDEVDALYERIEARGIDLTDDCGRESLESTYVNGDLAVATTDALQLFLNEVGRHKLLTA